MKFDTKENCVIYTKQEIKDILFDQWVEWLVRKKVPIEPGDQIKFSLGDTAFYLSIGTVMHEKIKKWIKDKRWKEVQEHLRRQGIHC